MINQECCGSAILYRVLGKVLKCLLRPSYLTLVNCEIVYTDSNNQLKKPVKNCSEKETGPGTVLSVKINFV